jgi:uncharacterized protein
VYGRAPLSAIFSRKRWNFAMNPLTLTTPVDLPAPLQQFVAEQPYPLVFATLSGAHLYGFPSPDSDFDLRGVHALPLAELVGLDTGPETLETSPDLAGFQLDLVTHEAKKFLGLLLKRNGYVLEQLYSPLIVKTSSAHTALKEIATDCITRHHHHHYLGFAQTQWRLFSQAPPHRVKPLLYIYRVLLTGIHLMQTGEVEANLINLNQRFNLPYLPELIAAKQTGSEKVELASAAIDVHHQEYLRLCAELEVASKTSTLPSEPSARPALHDWLLKLRLTQTV